jgi:hypothetical protein
MRLSRPFVGASTVFIFLVFDIGSFRSLLFDRFTLCVLPSVAMLIARDVFGFHVLLPYSATSVFHEVSFLSHFCGLTNAYQPTSQSISCIVSPICILKAWFIYSQFRMQPCI